MPYYRLCHFDELHQLTAADHLLAPNDGRALEMANERKSPVKWEVWAIGRYVGETGVRPI